MLCEEPRPARPGARRVHPGLPRGRRSLRADRLSRREVDSAFGRHHRPGVQAPGRFFVRAGIDNRCDNTYSGQVASALQTELKQRKPFKSLKEEAHLSIQRTAALLEHAFESALKPHGITATQYNVLRILRGAEPDGLCGNEIGARLVRQ